MSRAREKRDEVVEEKKVELEDTGLIEADESERVLSEEEKEEEEKNARVRGKAVGKAGGDRVKANGLIRALNYQNSAKKG